MININILSSLKAESWAELLKARLRWLTTAFQGLSSARCDCLQYKAPNKRSQNFSAIYRNIVGRSKVCAFCYPVATCCDT